MKYITESYNNKLSFEISEGQFKGVKFIFESLTSNGLKYKIISGKNLVKDSNKFLFENEIKQILSKYL